MDEKKPDPTERLIRKKDDLRPAPVTAPGRVPAGLIGACGEYYLAAELSRRGWLATVTIKNAPGTDVLAKSVNRLHMISLQTKTSSRGEFQLSEKDEHPGSGSGEFYALVKLSADLLTRPRFFLLPRLHVAKLIGLRHALWMHGPPVRVEKRKDSKMRRINPEAVDSYEERWDQLEALSERSAFIVPEQLVRMAKRWGVPSAAWLEEYARNHTNYALLDLSQEWAVLREKVPPGLPSF